MNDAEQSLSVLALLSNPRALKNIGLWQAELEENLSLARSVLENECVTESLTFLNVGIISLKVQPYSSDAFTLSGFLFPAQSFISHYSYVLSLRNDSYGLRYYVLDLDG